MAYRFALCLGVFFGLTHVAAAQGFRGQPVPRVIQFVPVNLEGKVVEVRPGMIVVATASSGLWRVGVSDNTAISVAGTATPDVLRPGLHIRFLATVEKQQSRVLDKVAKLTVFTPTNEDARTVGVFLPGQCRPVVSFLEEAAAVPPANPAGAGPGSPAGAAGPGKPAGAAAATGADPAAAAPSSAPKEQNAGDGNPAAAKDSYDIHAQITAGKGNWLTVKVPNRFFKSTLRVELAQEPLIELDLVNYMMARPGDKVSARGCPLGPNNFAATELLITLSEPQGHGRKKPPKLTAIVPRVYEAGALGSLQLAERE